MALLHVNFYSSVLRMASSMDVILPETSQGIGVDGQPPWDGKSLLPALYLLHGTTDDHTIWQRRTSLERYCAGRRLCVIMPNGHLSAYTNQKYGHRYLDFITEELPDICSKMFRISTAREDTFIAGLSMGGLLTLKAAAELAPDKIVVMAAPIYVFDKRQILLPFLHFLIRYVKKHQREFDVPEEYCVHSVVLMQDRANVSADFLAR